MLIVYAADKATEYVNEYVIEYAEIWCACHLM